MTNSVSIRLAKALMKAFPNFPTQENKNNYEIFKHNDYLNGSETEKKDIRLSSSKSRYEYEKIETTSIHISPNSTRQSLKIKKF